MWSSRVAVRRRVNDHPSGQYVLDVSGYLGTGSPLARVGIADASLAGGSWGRGDWVKLAGD